MSDHALLSPSRAHRWMACPGSIREESKYPDESGPAAVDGTHTHSLLEYCIKNDMLDPHSMVGAELTDHEGKFVVDDQRANRVRMALDYIKQRIAEYNGMCEVISETRVDPAYLIGRTDMSGTVDVQIRGGRVIELIDYKDGMNLVEADGNVQLLQYAIGVLAGFERPINAEYPFDVIRMTIIQPKLAMKGQNYIMHWELFVSEVIAKMGDFIVKAKATDDPNAPLIPGERQCKYCRAKGSCSALASNVMKEVGVMFQVTETSPLDLAHQSANKDPNTMTDQQIREIMEAAPLMRQLLESVEEEALRRMKKGQSIPGLKIVNGRGSRVWALPENEMAEKLVKLGIPKSEVYETKLLSPSKAEKVTWKKRDGTQKCLSERQIKTLNQEYVVKMAGKLTVAPESDDRPAVVFDASSMFGAIESQVPEAMPAWLM